MALVAQAFLWTGSQIPVYLLGAVPPYIYRELGGADRWIWFVLANLLSLAGICPFVGSLSDLLDLSVHVLPRCGRHLNSISKLRRVNTFVLDATNYEHPHTSHRSSSSL